MFRILDFIRDETARDKIFHLWSFMQPYIGFRERQAAASKIMKKPRNPDMVIHKVRKLHRTGFDEIIKASVSKETLQLKTERDNALEEMEKMKHEMVKKDRRIKSRDTEIIRLKKQLAAKTMQINSQLEEIREKCYKLVDFRLKLKQQRVQQMVPILEEPPLIDLTEEDDVEEEDVEESDESDVEHVEVIQKEEANEEGEEAEVVEEDDPDVVRVVEQENVEVVERTNVSRGELQTVGVRLETLNHTALSASNPLTATPVLEIKPLLPNSNSPETSPANTSSVSPITPDLEIRPRLSILSATSPSNTSRSTPSLEIQPIRPNTISPATSISNTSSVTPTTPTLEIRPLRPYTIPSTPSPSRSVDSEDTPSPVLSEVIPTSMDSFARGIRSNPGANSTMVDNHFMKTSLLL